MSEQPKIDGVDPAARELVAAARALVAELGQDMLRLGMAQAKGGEAAGDYYARACVEETWHRRMPLLVAVHDKLAAALNAASPDAPPLLSLTTEGPA
jgi:hypothetical protein